MRGTNINTELNKLKVKSQNYKGSLMLNQRPFIILNFDF
jgi:hypothetical protein